MALGCISDSEVCIKIGKTAVKAWEAILQMDKEAGWFPFYECALPQ